MNLRQAIPTDMTASAIAHLSLLALVFVFSDVHPFGSVTAETIAVDIVTPREIEKKPEPAPTPAAQLDFSRLEKPGEANAPAPAAQQPAPARPDRQAASAAPRPAQEQQAASQPQLQASSPAPAYRPPEPDLSIKYHVMLGLPPDISTALPLARAGEKAGDNFDAPANKAADVASSVVAEFRRH